MNHPFKRDRTLATMGFAFVLFGLLATCEARGQADPTATRALGLSVFGGATEAWPDYGHKGPGFVIGGDATKHFRWGDPSLEARYTYGSGDAVTEDVWTAGFKLEQSLGRAGRLHPYGDVLIGTGDIHFKHPALFNGVPYAQDNSIVKVIGGGLDFDLTSHFALKGDFQYSFWKLGSETSGLTPSYLSVGAVYRFKFGSLRRQR